MTDTVTNERLLEIAVSKSLYGSGITYLEFIGIASELLARRTAPAEPVAIKPLEWRGSWGTHSADTELGTYEIKPRYDGAADWFAPDQRKHWAPSATEAKAAAQADYEARSALASHTVSDEMVERATAGFEHGITKQTQDYQFDRTNEGQLLFQCGEWINLNLILRDALLAALGGHHA